MEIYAVRVGKENLGFAAGHFIALGVDGCESLHGHNFRVAAEVEAPLGADSLVIDFVLLKRIVEDVLVELDHKVLLPAKSLRFRVDADDRSVRVGFRDKAWVFPRGDCTLLPVENTTVELLAQWLGTRILEELRGLRGGASPPSLSRIRVEVEEAAGQSAAYERRLDPR